MHSLGFVNLQDVKLMRWNIFFFFYTLKEKARLANSSCNTSWVKTGLHLLFWHLLSFTFFAGENTAALYSNDVSIEVFLKVISYFSINCFHSCLLHQCLSIHVLSLLVFDEFFSFLGVFFLNGAVIALIPTSVLINGPHFIFLKCFTTS